MEHVFYSNTTAGNFTESERVYLVLGIEYNLRYDFYKNFTGRDPNSAEKLFLNNYVDYE